VHAPFNLRSQAPVCENLSDKAKFAGTFEQHIVVNDNMHLIQSASDYKKSNYDFNQFKDLDRTEISEKIKIQTYQLIERPDRNDSAPDRVIRSEPAIGIN
jgi:hypothetical protein